MLSLLIKILFRAKNRFRNSERSTHTYVIKKSIYKAEKQL